MQPQEVVIVSRYTVLDIQRPATETAALGDDGPVAAILCNFNLGGDQLDISDVKSLAGAVIFVHSAEGLFGASQDMQFAIFVLFALVLLLWRGSGEFTMDRLVRPSQAKLEAGVKTEV